MFTKVKELAHSLGISTILEGTNADDLKQYRPGIKAIKESGLHSPLLEANMTKKEIRELAATYGLKAANKPSSPCLATRFPYHTLLNYEEMRKVEKIEDYLHTYGFYNVRARIHTDIVRLEIDQDAFMKCMDKRQEIVLFIKELGYDYVQLLIQKDLEVVVKILNWRKNNMHMAHALVSPAVATTMYLASGAMTIYSIKKLEEENDPQKLPMMGVMGAFVFAAR